MPASASKPPDSPLSREAPDSDRLRLFSWLSCLVLAAWPFLVVTFPPLTDLPQHVAQVRLLFEEISPDGPYRVQWLTPYGLVYALFALAWKILPPLAAARLGAYLVLACFLSAVHFLAWRFQRPVAAALLASTLALNRPYYWGMFNFVFGFPLFVLFVVRLEKESDRPAPVRVLSVFVLALLLYLAHALWFAVGLGWLVVSGLIDFRLGRVEPRDLGLRAAGVLPVFLLAVQRFSFLKSTAIDTPTVFGDSVLLRLRPRMLSELSYGGIENPVELVCWLAVLTFIVAGLIGWILRSKEVSLARVDRLEPSLLLLGVILLGFYLFLPFRYTNTISFNQRWLPMAMVLLLLAMPRLRLRTVLPVALSALLFAGLVTTTVNSWRSFDRQEMTGLAECLEALPESPRVLGLDYRRGSDFVDGLPFMHASAWGQVVRGGVQNFSFTHFASSLVVDRSLGDPIPWTRNLEWEPFAVQHSDYDHFDYLLIGAGAGVHQQFRAEPRLAPVTETGALRLYRVQAGLPLRPR